MSRFRSFLHSHKALAALLLAAVLCLKVLIPAGFMPGLTGTVLTVSICADSTGERLTRHIVIPAKGSPDGQRSGAGGECAFTALTMGALGGADLVLLALAAAFILALGFAPVTFPAPRGSLRLRPPLRGPPRTA